MVNNIAHFGCSRQTINNHVNRYNITGSVRGRARPGRARETHMYISHYHINTPT